ncbi:MULTISPECIES: DUF3618 domain-containing protein [Catenuloplanes]|uniref:Gas vesicle protein n=1 Tax=Catenuloplanes niger TaxID=587534 RepID=A0AAE4CYP4_9ACTN|nr:DUF3618 domain-containing protein [Catenuloplanes niger]MDR7326084.1 gas vesicle protein [Catenuloplanes niger]
MTSSDPDQIRAEIERTRAGLSSDVDALAYKASPTRIVEDRKQRVRDALRNTREKIMGTASDAGSTVAGKTSGAAHAVSDKASGAAQAVSDKASGAAHAVSDKASDAADAVRQAPSVVKTKAEGNPLAAGLIAFGAGWLISSLLPATQKERELAASARTAVQENKETLVQEAKQLAGELQDNLRGPAEEAAGRVRDTATDAAATVRDEGRSAAEDVKGRASEAREKVS